MTAEEIRIIFAGAGDFIDRTLCCGGHTLYAFAIDGLVSGSELSDFVLRPIAENLRGEDMQTLYRNALTGGVYNGVAEECKDAQSTARRLVNGSCVVLFPEVGAIAFEIKTGVRRGPSAPDVENTVKGPKDSFVETIRINTSLLRRHLRTPQLRIENLVVGRRSLTNVAVIWIQGITNRDLVRRLRQRLEAIDIDAMLSTASVEEYVTGSRATAFPLIQYTQRPDRFAQGLLDGRVGLMVDGLPLAYLAPADIGYLMESPEDRSRDYISASCIRILRYGALLLSLLLPAAYIALVMYHESWISGKLQRILLDGTAERPFTAAAEVLGLLIAYELLQESGIHLPQAIGQSVSTIGGIVVGTAAVEAGLIGSMVLIVVSITGICGFVLPNRDLAQAVRVWRFGIAVLAMMLGGWGVAVGAGILLVHLASLRSLGVCYLMPVPGNKGLLRRRLKNQRDRDARLNPQDRKNQKKEENNA